MFSAELFLWKDWKIEAEKFKDPEPLNKKEIP